MPTELTIRNAIVRALKGVGCYVLVTTGVADSGTPDLLVCWRGRFIALEVKREGMKATKLQRQRIETIHGAGGTATTVHSVEEALGALGDKYEK